MIRDINNRTRLESAIPLATPFVVHIDTCNACNFRCKFCTTGDHDLLKSFNRPRGFMPLALFKKIIDDLAVFPNKIKDLLMHKNGEPLLHPDIIEMLNYAKKRDVANKIILVTNASLLTPELARGICESGVDYIQISIESVSDAGYKDVSQVDVSYDKIVFSVAYLYANKKNSHINVKIMDIGLSEDQKQKFLSDFTPIGDSIGVEHLISYTQPHIKDTSLGIKKETTHDAYERKYKDICTLPFYTLNINFTGTVSACSFDWRHALIMGDVNSQHLSDIWNGSEYNAFRVLQLHKNRNLNKYCDGCEAVYNLLDNIDEFGELLLKKYE